MEDGPRESATSSASTRPFPVEKGILLTKETKSISPSHWNEEEDEEEAKGGGGRFDGGVTTERRVWPARQNTIGEFDERSLVNYNTGAPCVRAATAASSSRRITSRKVEALRSKATNGGGGSDGGDGDGDGSDGDGGDGDGDGDGDGHSGRPIGLQHGICLTRYASRLSL
uniref:Uncharacterized protein n=1 Tax=Vespula pensylvanica TaxID=30213 RepID=A0A834UG87_VESPE|nr:hypothetical protein H0235_000243 [Vespula pensylvanica]